MADNEDTPETLRSTPQGNPGEDELEEFRSLIAAVDLNALVSVALQTRIDNSSTGGESQEHKPQFSCEIDTDPVAGAYNLVYFLTFSDGVRWVARLPGHGISNFTELDRQAMISDYHTIRLVRSRINMPIPKVFLVETDSEVVGAPFALISFVPGKPVSQCWFDEAWMTEDKRRKILRGLAVEMSKLHVLEFDQIGSLQFNANGYVARIGPEIGRHMDSEKIRGLNSSSLSSEQAEAFNEDEQDVSNRTLQDHEQWQKLGTSSKVLTERADSLTSGRTASAGWGRIQTSGPFNTVREWFFDDWDDLRGQHGWRKVQLAILRLAVESIPEHLISQQKYYPSPPDMDSQNIFIDDDGNITGIIDWDGVATQCPIGGFARYPSWITRDWDPMMYGYGVEECQPENSPEELSRYRQVYAAAFASLDLPASSYSADETKLSHIFEAIKLAADSRMLRDGIVPKLLEHAFRSEVPFDMDDFEEEYLADTAGSCLKQIEEAFKNMWHAEWAEVDHLSKGLSNLQT